MTGTDNNLLGKLSLVALKYVGTKLDNCKFKCINNLSIISNRILVTLVATMIGTVVLQMLGFSLAFLIAEITGSLALGFALISITFALFLVLVYIKRDTLFISNMIKMYKKMFF